MRIFLPIAIAISLLVPSAWSKADDAGTRAHLVKTAFIYNFSKFVEWPEDNGKSTDAFTICLMGPSPYGGTMSQLEKKQIKGRDVVLLKLTKEVDPKSCWLVYVSDPFGNAARELLTRWQEQPILFVAESADFTRLGGGIGMYVEEERVRFSVNEGAIRRHGLKVSSRLLDVASTVIQ